MLIFFVNELYKTGFLKNQAPKILNRGTNRPQKISFYISQNTEKSV